MIESKAASTEIGVGDALEKVHLRLSNSFFAVSVLDCAEASFAPALAPLLLDALGDVRDQMSGRTGTGKWSWLFGGTYGEKGSIVVRLETVDVRVAPSGLRLFLSIFLKEGSFDCLQFELDELSVSRLLSAMNDVVNP